MCILRVFVRPATALQTHLHSLFSFILYFVISNCLQTTCTSLKKSNHSQQLLQECDRPSPSWCWKKTILCQLPTTTVGGERHAIGLSVHPAVRAFVRPSTPIAHDAISLHLVQNEWTRHRYSVCNTPTFKSFDLESSFLVYAGTSSEYLGQFRTARS